MKSLLLHVQQEVVIDLNPQVLVPYIRDLLFVITAAADALAPNGARTSAATVLIKLDMLSSKFLWIPEFPCYLCWPNDWTPNGQWDLSKFHGLSSVRTYVR